MLQDASQQEPPEVVQEWAEVVDSAEYPAQDKVQLLLPLSLLDASVVDLALVVSRQGEYYRGHTVLTTAMAYNNARLLARQDSDWLQPAVAEDEV